MIDPIMKIDPWPMGYCESGGMHSGEHPLYTSSDGGCIKFVTSERLLGIKQLFDLTIKNETLQAELEDFYTSTTPSVSKIEFDNWILEDEDYEDIIYYSAKGGNITRPAYFRIKKYGFSNEYKICKVVEIAEAFNSLEDAQKFAEEF